MSPSQENFLGGLVLALMVLGGIAGISLLLRAIFGKGDSPGWGVETLWALFLIGIAACVILVVFLL